MEAGKRSDASVFEPGNEKPHPIQSKISARFWCRFNFVLDSGVGSRAEDGLVMGTAAQNGHPMRSAELAELAGVSTDALRHYERVGVLPPPERTAGNYRVYPPGALARVQMVKRALAFGFTLAELASIFKVREQGGTPCRAAKKMGEAKLQEVERKLAELSELRAELKKLLRDWDRRLARVSGTERAKLLESLPDTAALMTSGKNPFKRGHRPK
jgi:DNA-binding transcriptional MerR regulator